MGHMSEADVLDNLCAGRDRSKDMDADAVGDNDAHHDLFAAGQQLELAS